MRVSSHASVSKYRANKNYENLWFILLQVTKGFRFQKNKNVRFISGNFSSERFSWKVKTIRSGLYILMHLSPETPIPPPTPGRRGAYVGICKCLYDFLISHFQSLILQNHGAVTASAVKVNVPVTIWSHMNCHSVSKVCQKSRTLHISLLNVNQSLKNPNLWSGLKLKILSFKAGLFLRFFRSAV